MTELIKVNYDANNDKPTVSGRELHRKRGLLDGSQKCYPF